MGEGCKTMINDSVVRCPNECEIKKFVTVAHVSEEWLVDEAGNFLKVLQQLEVLHGPSTGNIWSCANCGAESVTE